MVLDADKLDELLKARVERLCDLLKLMQDDVLHCFVKHLVAVDLC